MVSDSSATTTSYCSTRGGAKGVSFEDVVLGGLAEDRGLYVPEELPTVSTEELAEVCAPLRGVRRRFEGPFAEVGAVWRGISVPSRLVSWSHVFFCGATYAFQTAKGEACTHTCIRTAPQDRG